MATTTNYGWTTPDDTDLVKDGAAAIRTLGSAIDTTTENLNPSTTEGDMEYRSAAADTNARLAIGTAGQVLTVNSGANAPEWATPAAATPTFVGAFVTKSANQSILNATGTLISFDTESFDTNGFHDNVTNNTRFTIPTGYAGKYLVTGILVWAANASGQRVNYILKNGSLLHLTSAQPLSAGGATTAAIVSQVIDLAVGDYVELQCYQDSGGALNMTGTNSWDTNFSISYLGV